MNKSSILVILLSFTILVTAQQKPIVKTQPIKPTEQPVEVPSGKFVGMLFNDASYTVQEPLLSNPVLTQSGKNSFLFRRVTIGYEYSYNKNVTAVIKYDANSKLLEQGFVDIKNIAPMMDFKIGVMQTLSSEVIEKIWDYRSLESSVLDRKSYTNEFDMGMLLTGKTNVQGNTYARLAIYNGNGVLPENDKLKKIAFAAGNWFDKSSVLEIYADYENLAAGKSTINAKLFYGMASSKMAFGVEGFYRLERKMSATGGDNNPVGGSVFSWYEIMKSLRAVARIDVTDNDLAITTSGYREIYLNAGIDYMPIPEVHMIPNLIYAKNLKKGTGIEIADGIIVRLTTAVTF